MFRGNVNTHCRFSKSLAKAETEQTTIFFLIKGASPKYFAEDNVIVTFKGGIREGVRAVTLSLVETYVTMLASTNEAR